MPIDFKFNHNANNLFIAMTSNITTTDKSWGIRDFELSYLACNEDCKVCTNSRDDTCNSWISAAESW